MSYGGYNQYDNDGPGRGYGSDPFHDRNAVPYGAGGTHEMSSFSPGDSPQVSPYSQGNSPRTTPYSQGNTPQGPSYSPGNTPRMAQQNYGSAGTPKQTSLLDECTDIQSGIQDVENKLGVLAGLQRRALDDADMTSGSNTKRELDNLTQAIMDQYRKLTVRLKAVKSNPESRHPRNVAQINKTERDLRRAIQRFQELESGSRKEMQARVERQARIVHPDATDDEIAEIVNSDTQIFQQAVMGSRTDQANRVLGAVKQRHQEMLQIEKSLLELLDLLNDMQVLLMEQEKAVEKIDENAGTAADQLVQANTELETAVTTARKTRKKKWICLGICVLIIVIIVVAVVAYIMINRAANGGGEGSGGDNSAKKRNIFHRSVLDEVQMNTARAAEIATELTPTRRQARAPNAETAFSMRPPRRLSSARGVEAAAHHDNELVAKKRFVVDWEGIDGIKSDD